MTEKRICGLFCRFALACILTVSFIINISLVPVSGAENKIRVGFFKFSGYHEISADGTRSGYGYDFFQKIGALDDWTFDYSGYDLSYSDNLDMLERGELDVVTSASKTPEREKMFLFSDEPIGTNATIFTVKAGNTNVIAKEYSTYNGLKIGMLKGNSKNDNFYNFSLSHGFKYDPVYFDTEDELSRELQSGNVDGIVSGSLRSLHNEWLIESMNESDFYVVVNKNNEQLMKRINNAIHELDLKEPDWRNVLNRKYYSLDTKGSVMLDSEERDYLREFISSGRKLKVLVNPEMAPYSYFENGEAKGIFPAIFRKFADKNHIDYEFIKTQSHEEYHRVRKSGTADIVLDFNDTFYNAEEEGYKLTDTYLETDIARLIRKKHDGDIKKIGVIIHSDLLRSYIEGIYAPEDIINYTSMDECIDAVNDGSIDAAVMCAYTAARITRNDVKNRYSYALMGDLAMSYCMGVSNRESHLLISVLNKEIVGLGAESRSAIIMKEADLRSSDGDHSLVDFLYVNPVYGMAALLFISLFAIVCIVLITRLNAQKTLKKKIEEVSRKYEIKEQELSEALVMADQANRAKTTFLNNMSHDIRTPMNAIIGFTALASAHLDNTERAKDYLSKIAQSSDHLLSLINDVLDMSRIESGNVHIEEKPENLAEILHGLRNIIQADIHAKHLELFIDTVDVSNENICCDKLRLNQILLNLLSNAIKFTEPGGTITLRVTQKPSKKEHCGVYEFLVKDTGIGMSPKFAKTIFEPFTRERTSTVSGIQGTGLGMSITKNIVDMMKGTISVNSQPGKGTEFVVELEFSLHGETLELSELTELRGKRSLVVDDDVISCQSVSKMLREMGLRSEWTMYGKEAVVRTEEALDMGDPYEVYIIDWSMPDMNGIETVRRIRRVIGNEAPIILLSAYDWSDVEDEAYKAGVTDFISKPLFASDLHYVLERTVNNTDKEEVNEIKETDFKGKRILLAEDNELNREIAVEILGNMGFSVDSAENGKEAYEAVRDSQPGYYDLVLMDIQMPVMDGYEATEKIRGLDNDELSNIPIIAMTANAFEEDRLKAIESGMNDHLAKPIDMAKLTELLKKTLR